MLPNVSAIYRDLSFMANPNHSQRQVESNRFTPVSGMYEEKQAKHSELMEKLRNAQKESSYINQQLRGMDTLYPSSSTRGSYNIYQPFAQPQRYQYSDFLSSGQQQSKQKGTWKAPNIRYRHIQDFKKPQIPVYEQQSPAQNISKQRLEKEFYGNQDRQREEVKENSRNEAVQVENRKPRQPQLSKLDQISQTSYGKTWINKQSKFEDKLQSYYELCKKRPASRKTELSQSQQPNKTRFTRTGNNRPTVLQLQKAIRMLSLE